MRVALYARYSSDQQRAASIDDQLRVCREFAARQGWTVVAHYADAATSGATLMRVGIQSLLRDVAEKRFDVVLAESLDRFSRDLADTAVISKRLKFRGVSLVTISEGDISHLQVGFKGTMNALFLQDLADKTRRGLRGRIEDGRSAGGVSYGYRVAPTPEGQPRGSREIHPGEAAIVRRIFGAFVDGVSPKAIAKALNVAGISGPRGGVWSPSTIHGHVGRGTGILNNELYVGRLVWNRQKFEKDPDSGKRVPRPNPPSGVIVKDVPELRIVPNDLWEAAKARQAATRQNVRTGMVRARRPKYLFSGLTKCAVCGGGYVLSSHDLLTCSNARSRGTCTNRRSIKRQEIEARALRAMRERLFDPGAFAAFCEGFTAEMELQRRERLAERRTAQHELAAVERKQREILTALADGYRSEAWKAELLTLDDRKASLTASLAEPQLPALHPNMAEVFRQKATALAAGLEHDDQRDAAREALRSSSRS
jgi:site-specific DNA recombinase